MSWIQNLYQTYEYCSKISKFTQPPQSDDDKQVAALMPVSHTRQQAHIHVIIDGQGNFKRAALLPPKTQVTIPATEPSAGRTSGDAPHPLSDKLHYCAQDYNGTKKNLFDPYITQLDSWCQSEHGHPKAQAVLAYLKKGTLTTDLINAGILFADQEGHLLTEAPEVPAPIFKILQAKKIKGKGIKKEDEKTIKDQGEAVVVWSVNIPNDSEPPETWQDKSLQKSWITYDASQMAKEGFCLVSSDPKAVITTNHPRYILKPGDGSKLISASSKEDVFTYKGRFETDIQACTVGYEASHKAHNALRWLIARQGYRTANQAVVAWAAVGAEVPQPCENTWLISDADSLDFDTPDDDSLKAVPGPDYRADMGQSFSTRLSKCLQGYKKQLDSSGGIAVMVVKAPGPGRLSVTYYQEQFQEEYFNNLMAWQQQFGWQIPCQVENEAKPGHKKTIYTTAAPTPRNIAEVAYGSRLDDNQLCATIERILPCIVEAKRNIPYDLVENCLRRAVNRVALEKWEWNKALTVACAVYKGFYNRKEGRNYDMPLDLNRTSRDYLYGRLLATAEYAERSAMSEAGKRPTNAERLMVRFADAPCSTWLILEKQINPYLQRLQVNNPGLFIKVKKTLGEIHDKFAIDEFTSKDKLSGEFLLGYYSQNAAFYQKSPNNIEATEEQGE